MTIIVTRNSTQRYEIRSRAGVDPSYEKPLLRVLGSLTGLKHLVVPGCCVTFPLGKG